MINFITNLLYSIYVSIYFNFSTVCKSNPQIYYYEEEEEKIFEFTEKALRKVLLKENVYI